MGLTFPALGQLQIGPEREYIFEGNLVATKLVLNNVPPRQVTASVTLWWNQTRIGPEVFVSLIPSAADPTIWVGKFSTSGIVPEGALIRLMAWGRVTYFNRRELLLEGTQTLPAAAEPIIDYGDIPLKIISLK